jgi:small subunit ribosomal protein S20
MPITTSAKKAMRQAKTRNAQNTKRKDAYKKLLSRCRKLISEKKTDDAKKMLSDIYQALDKAAKTNAIAKNKAARIKSRITKILGKK